MSTLQDAATDFLTPGNRIAVAGVSRTKQDAANAIYKKLRASGFEVFPINPNAETVEGDTCYKTVQSIPGHIDGVVIVTKPEITEQVVRDCVKAQVSWVWMHKGMGSSVSPEAVQLCREQEINLIPGACPMMYCDPVDIAHKCFRWWWGLTGKLPEPLTAQS